MKFDQIVARFENRRASTDGVTARCPAHDDRANSLKISAATDRVLMNCFAGCTVESIVTAKGLKLADLFYEPRNGDGGSSGSRPHLVALSLKQFADAKGLGIDFLAQMGVAEEKNALIFHYLLVDGQRAARQRIRLSLTGDKRFIWNRAEGRPVPYGLWRLKESRAKSGDLYLVEGESDSLTLWLHGYTAIGIPGADNCQTLQAAHVTGFKRVFIVRENDHGGEVFEKGCVGRLAAIQFEGAVRAIEMGRAEVKDANDLHLKFLAVAGAFESEFQALVEIARPVELPITGLEIFDASLVQERELKWLWPGRIPLAKLVLFVGHPGLGKSFTALDVVAHLSSGKDWPDGIRNGAIAKSVVFSAEDSIEDTIVPRLAALGAARGNVMLARRLREANEAGEIVRRSFNLARDLPHLERTLDRHPDTRLVVVDPVSAYMGRTDSHKNAEVRSDVLDPLSELAERRGVTVLAITHFNKTSGGNSLERISGSVAFPAAARVVWGFARDPEDSSRRLMVFGKSNVGPETPGLAFRIVGREDGRAVIEWQPGAIDANLNEVMALEAEQQHDLSSARKLESAKKLLREMLADGPRLYDEILRAASAAGISDRTVRRAGQELQIEKRRSGFGGGFKVSLPKVNV